MYIYIYHPWIRHYGIHNSSNEFLAMRALCFFPKHASEWGQQKSQLRARGMDQDAMEKIFQAQADSVPVPTAQPAAKWEGHWGCDRDLRLLSE